MKNIKKLLSIVMVLTLVLSLGASAFATDVTIDDKDVNSTYTAWQLLTATYNKDTGLYSYVLNEKFLPAIKAGLTGAKVTNVTVGGEEKAINDLVAADGPAIIDAISTLTEEQARQFADAAFDAIQKDAEMKNLGIASSGHEFPGLNGYYLIAETVKGEDENTATSLVMMGTIGAGDKTTITTKEDRPESNKKVKEKDDTTGNETGWQDAADYDIGDDVPFKLEATIPAKALNGYTEYSLTFHDKQSEGLTFNADSVKVTVNGTVLEKNDGYTVVAPGSDGCAFDVVFEDIMKVDGFQANAQNVITVEYTSKLNERAEIGPTGNPNEMHIEYSNNPYGDGTGKTPDDKVTVFTFKLDVNKVDGAGEPLDGAGFTLLKEVKSAPEGVEAASVTWETLGAKTTGEYVTYNGKTYQVFHQQITGETTFEFKGLDSAKYLLVETTVPENYNRAADTEIIVEATYDTNSADPKLTGLTVTPSDIGFTATPASGTISGNVINLTGVELPSTGGIGTTIFYVVGGILVAAAVILLVTRRRVTGAEK